jgi:hypothetical protein
MPPETTEGLKNNVVLQTLGRFSDRNVAIASLQRDYGRVPLYPHAFRRHILQALPP